MAPAAMGKSFASNTHRGLLEAATESVEEVPLALADPLAAMAPTMASPFASNTHRGLLEASATVTEVPPCAVSAAPTLSSPLQGLEQVGSACAVLVTINSTSILLRGLTPGQLALASERLTLPIICTFCKVEKGGHACAAAFRWQPLEGGFSHPPHTGEAH